MSPRNAPLGIVVGIDDSPAARVAVQWAARDAELRNVPLTLVHAVSPEVSTWLKTPMPAGVMRW
ncbi:MAG TPA: universal stress protein, partial [Mycobacterium sp.]|nr:universal stress protein [Mycobacterium sp.]